MKMRVTAILLICLFVTFPLFSLQQEHAVYPKVALVLSGGSALGFAHIGVLKVIEEVGIPVDLVVGTSMGGLVGALYSIGYTPNEIVDIAGKTDWMDLFSSPDSPYTFNIGPVIEQEENIISLSFDGGGLGRSLGLIPDQKIITFMSELTNKVSHIRDFDKFSIPFRSVAVDLLTRKAVVFDSGRIVDAMRSTMAVPFLFAPYEIDGQYYLDGGILNNLPTDVARDLGADIIIAVDVDWDPIDSIRDVKTPVDLVMQFTEIVIEANEVLREELADLVIKPDLKGLSTMDYSRSREFIDAGEEAAVLLLPELIELREQIGEFRETQVPDKNRTGVYKGLPAPKVRRVVIADEVDFFFPLYMFTDLQGRTVTPAYHTQIRRVINQIASTGKYESISYSLIENEESSYDLELKPVTLERGKHSLGIGFGYNGAASFSGDEPAFVSSPRLTSSLVFTELFETNSYAALNLRIGDETRFDSELFVPFGGLVYLKPRISLHRGENSPNGITSESTLFSFSQEFGFLVGQHTEIGAAARANQYWVVPETGSTQSSFELFYGPSITWKTTDKRRFLHEGAISNAALLLPMFGGESWYGKILFDHEQHIPLGYNSTISYDVQVGSYRGALTSIYSGFDIGGWDGIPGYLPRDEIFKDMYLAGICFNHRFEYVSSILGVDVYGLTSFRVGKGFESVFQDFTWSPDFGGAAGVGLSTAFGDIILGAGVNDQGEFAYYLMIN
jgi:NTE family protein